MTRREYPIPAHLSGARLASELTAAGILTDPMGVSVTGDVLVIVWGRDLSTGEIAQADAVVAAHHWTDQDEQAARRAQIKQQAVALAGSLDDAQAVIARAGNRVTYQAVAALWQATRALIAWANAQGAGLQQLPPARTWKQVLDAGRTLASSETDPEA